MAGGTTAPAIEIESPYWCSRTSGGSRVSAGVTAALAVTHRERRPDGLVLRNVVQSLLFGLGDEIANALTLSGGWVDAAAREPGEQDMKVVTQL